MSKITKSMTQAQKAAYDRPCYEAEDCFNLRYFFVVQRGKIFCSVGLTANVGLE